MFCVELTGLLTLPGVSRVKPVWSWCVVFSVLWNSGCKYFLQNFWCLSGFLFVVSPSVYGGRMTLASGDASGVALPFCVGLGSRACPGSSLLGDHYCCSHCGHLSACVGVLPPLVGHTSSSLFSTLLSTSSTGQGPAWPLLWPPGLRVSRSTLSGLLHFPCVASFLLRGASGQPPPAVSVSLSLSSGRGDDLS